MPLLGTPLLGSEVPPQMGGATPPERGSLAWGGVRPPRTGGTPRTGEAGPSRGADSGVKIFWGQDFLTKIFTKIFPPPGLTVLQDFFQKPVAAFRKP